MEIRVNVIYRSKNVSQTAVSPKPAIALVKVGNQAPIAQSEFRSDGWRMSFQSDLGINVF